MEPRSARVRLRVTPGASRPAIVGRYGDAWKIRVAAAPEKGHANDAVVALLAETVGVARSDVRVVTGLASRDKVVELAGVTPREAEGRLAAGKESA